MYNIRVFGPTLINNFFLLLLHSSCRVLHEFYNSLSFVLPIIWQFVLALPENNIISRPYPTEGVEVSPLLIESEPITGSMGTVPNYKRQINDAYKLHKYWNRYVRSLNTVKISNTYS